jgi:hypothetical protein
MTNLFPSPFSNGSLRLCIGLSLLLKACTSHSLALDVAGPRHARVCEGRPDGEQLSDIVIFTTSRDLNSELISRQGGML